MYWHFKILKKNYWTCILEVFGMILVQYVSVFVIRLFYIKGKILIFFLCQKYISTIKGKISCFLLAKNSKFGLLLSSTLKFITTKILLNYKIGIFPFEPNKTTCRKQISRRNSSITHSFNS